MQIKPKPVFDTKKLKKSMENLDAQIKFDKINNQAYDGSHIKWYEIDELGLMENPRKNPMLIKDCFKIGK